MISLFKKTYTLPFKCDIPNNTTQFLNSKSIFQRFGKFFRRYLYITINGNLALEQDHIKKSQNSILWINLSASSLGDSLMDLSSRILIKEKNIDLFASSKNAHIYRHDEIFNNIITDAKKINKNKYDLVILDSYGTKSMRIKFRYLKNLPFVGMFGFYNGPELNRVLFSFHRMNQLLNYPQDDCNINAIARSIMFISDEDKALIQSLNLLNYTAIAIGGEWGYRTYDKWIQVIEGILQHYPRERIVLVGSANAKNTEQEIVSYFQNNTNIVSLVDRYSFNQTIQVINNARILLCCDGGIMCGASSVSTTIIPLFATLTAEMRLTNSINAYPLYDATRVSNIPVTQVVAQYIVASQSKLI